jgi:AraC-like DNA-binding protein
MSHKDKTEVLVNVVNERRDDKASGDDLARDANYSRFHFIRVFQEQTGETPSECRRRLLLERAAHQLLHTRRPVTNIAFAASFDSLEGFSRAFRKAFGLSPSMYRRVEPLCWFLPAPNSIHFNPIIGAAVKLKPAPEAKERAPMDLTDRLIDHDMWLTKRILEKAATLTDAQLDAPMSRPEQPVCFEEPEKTLRDVLNKIVFTKEVWLCGVYGREFPDASDTSAAGLLKRYTGAFADFGQLVKKVRDDDLWDTNFVDVGCEPPETFTYGGMIAHVLTFSTYRLMVALREMQRLGVTDLGYGDPLTWEMGSTPATC